MVIMADIVETITETINTVVDKAREYGEVARLQALIKAEEAKKQEYYYKLGKKYYEKYKDAPASDLMEYMSKLVAADEKIADYKEDLKVASAKDKKEADESDGSDTETEAEVVSEEEVSDQ